MNILLDSVYQTVVKQTNHNNEHFIGFRLSNGSKTNYHNNGHFIGFRLSNGSKTN